jgi:hypothetical protein
LNVDQRTAFGHDQTIQRRFDTLPKENPGLAAGVFVDACKLVGA